MTCFASLLGFRSHLKEISDDERSVASATTPPPKSESKSKNTDEEKLEVESNKDEDEDDQELGEDEWAELYHAHNMSLIGWNRYTVEAITNHLIDDEVCVRNSPRARWATNAI